jgi:hypothetical protein
MAVLGHGVVVPAVETGADGFGVRTEMGGLRPPAPSSVEPSGIPTRPTDDSEPMVGDEADAAGPDKPLLPMVAQVPDAVPVVPPPSNTDVKPGTPAVDVPDKPVVDVPVVELLAPKEACGIAPPIPEHGKKLPVGTIGEAPDVVGLTPGVASSVAPKGMPVGATGEPGPMPSGDVMASDEGPGDPPTCAKAGLPLTSAASIAAISTRSIMSSPCCAKSSARLRCEAVAGVKMGAPRLAVCSILPTLVSDCSARCRLLQAVAAFSLRKNHAAAPRLEKRR